MDDDGAAWRAREKVECRIDPIAQGWSVLTVDPADRRTNRALPSAHERLTALFDRAKILDRPTEGACFLPAGMQTACISITVTHLPQTYTPDPFCPSHITDGGKAGGIWFLDGETVDVDRAFIKSLCEVYGDADWHHYGPATPH